MDHFIPVDKKLDPDWVRRLGERGEPVWCRGTDLETIGMPVGGICSGQVYLLGDGRLHFVDILNRYDNTGYGAANYRDRRRATEVVVNNRDLVQAPVIDQGFGIRVDAEGRSRIRALDARDFPNVAFRGEYPIGWVEYGASELPVDIALEAFSPFIPLNAPDSSLPATLLRFRVANRSQAVIGVTLAGWLENAVGLHTASEWGESLVRTNRVERGDGVTTVEGSVRPAAQSGSGAQRAPDVFADFEGGHYGGWTAEGDAFGKAPARGTLPNQQHVSGYRGDGLVNTYLGGDGPTGRLVSPEFTVNRPWIGFLIGGGAHEGETVINLRVAGDVVRTATGRGDERLRPHNWHVADLIGASARLEIVDRASGGWGHINIDQIEFRDEPMGVETGDLKLRPDYGTMALSVLGADALASAALPAGDLPEQLFSGDGLACDPDVDRPASALLRGAVGQAFQLAPGEERHVVFSVTWHMPNLYRGDRRVGRQYSHRFRSAAEVAQYVAAQDERLAGETRRWHETWYDASLPRWLLSRMHSTVSNLATTTCQWWENGRFWAFEGCGCCHGTCGHVWNYAQAMARLFPELERSVRDMQDFAAGAGFVAETGEIRFRGEGWGNWAGDAQGGYILKAWREHLCSTGDQFLRRHWPQIRKATEFLIQQDADDDGLIEGVQHQTYDQNYFGANTMVGSLYLGALRAAEEMARELGDGPFAERCRKIFEAGTARSVERLYNGEYFIQEVDLDEHPEWQYGDGCLADQLFGQSWAHQVGLGYLYPAATVKRALAAIWDYCWAPDVGRQNERHAPERWFAYPGEAGLFTCTWPKSRHLGPRSTRYRNEVWTGIEYQVASHMAAEGMTTEALALCRAIEERYQPAKRNPFNEIECGDHYARALASWGVLIGLTGFIYHGPKGRIGFAPRIHPDDFKAPFTAAEGWGTLTQQRSDHGQTNSIQVRWGRLTVRELVFHLAGGKHARQVLVDGNDVDGRFDQDGDRVRIRLDEPVVLQQGTAIRVDLRT